MAGKVLAAMIWLSLISAGRTDNSGAALLGHEVRERATLDPWYSALVLPDPGMRVEVPPGLAARVTGWKLHLLWESQVVLSMWRGSGQDYTLVGRTNIRLSQPGEHTVPLPQHKRFWVRTGDTLGLEWQATNPVPYDKVNCPGGRDVNLRYLMPPPKGLRTGDSRTFTSGDILPDPCRNYSFQAMIQTGLDISDYQFSLSARSYFPNPPGIVSFNLTLPESTDITSDRIMCTFRFDNQDISSQPMTSHLLSLSYQFPPGDLGYRKVIVICQSALTEKLVDSFLTLKAPLTGLAVAVSRDTLTVSDFLNLEISCISGESVTTLVEFGDRGVNQTRMFPDERCNKYPAFVEHRFSRTGEFHIRVHGWNIVTPNQTTEVLVRVLEPIHNMVLNVSTHVRYPPGLLNMSVIYQGEQQKAPIDVTLTWTVTDPSGTHLPMNMLKTLPTSNSTRDNIYKEYEHVQLALPNFLVGDFSITVNCSNPVSHQVLRRVVTVEAVISQATLTLASYAIASGERLSGHVQIQGGNALNLVVHYGDNISEELVVPDHPLDESVTINFSHRYLLVGNYTITAQVKNNVSSVNASSSIAVLKPIAGFLLGSNLKTLYHKADVPVAFLIEFLAGSDVSLWLDFDDGSPTEHIRINDAAGYSQLHQNTFKEQRDYNITGEACNLLGCMNVSLAIDVYFPVEDLTLSSNSPVTYPPGQISLLLEHTGDPSRRPGEVSLQWSFIDSQGRDRCQDRPDTFPPTSAAPGITEEGRHLEVVQLDGTMLCDYRIYLICSNPVSSVEMSTHVLAQAAIGMVRLRVEQIVVATGQAMDIVLTIASGSHEHVTLRTGDGTVYHPLVPDHIWDSPVDIHVHHTYFTFREYQIHALVINNVSMAEDQATVSVHQEVKDIIVTCSPTKALVGQNVTVTIEMTAGTDVTVNVSFSDGQPPVVKRVTDPSMLPVIFTKTFTSVGTYSVHIETCNKLGCKSGVVPTSIIVQYPVKNVTYLLNNSPFITIDNQPGPVDISLFIASDTPKPRNVNISCVTPGGIVEGFRHDFFHSFELKYKVHSSGFHKVECTLINFVGSTVLGIQVFVYEEISPPILRAFSSGKNILDENNTLVMSQSYPVNIQVDSAFGSNMSVNFDFGDFDTESTQVWGNRSLIVSHRYRQPGKYMVNVQVSNAVSNASTSTQFVIQREVSLINLGNPCPCPGHTNITINLWENQVPTDACYIWDMGDQSEKTIMGGQQCLKAMPSNGSINVVPLEDPAHVNHKHVYLATGSYNVTVRAYNLISSQVVEQIINITSICGKPGINFQDGVGTYRSPVRRQRSECFKVEAMVTVHCPPMETLVFNWSLHTNGNNGSHPIDMQKEPNSPRLQFSPDELGFGVYKAEMTVYPSPYIDAIASSTYFFQIIPSHLAVAIVGGPTVSIPADIPLTLNGLDMTYDPDEALAARSHKGMTFSWHCRLIHESFAEESLLGVQKVGSGTGGCFGDGQEKLTESGGILVVPAGVLTLGKAYVFRLVVRKHSRSNFFEQEVKVVDDPPLDIHIRCITNCGPKVNPSSQLSLEASCLNCAEQGDLTWAWTLLATNTSHTSHQQQVNLEPLTITGIGQRSVSLRAGSLRTGFSYRLRAQASRQFRRPGSAVYPVLVNIPPYGGYCHVTPSTGFAFETQFVVRCFHWTDEGTRARVEEAGCDGPVTYRVGYRRREDDPVQYLYLGAASTSRGMLLPAGQPQHNGTVHVVVQVVDAGDEATTLTYPVQVLLNLTKEELSAEVQQKTTEMTSLMTSGDIQQGVELAHSLLALVDHDVPEGDPSESNSSDTATWRAKSEVVGQVVDAVAGSYRPLATFSEVMQVFSVMDAAVQSKDVMDDVTQVQASVVMEEMAVNLASLNQTSNKDMVNALTGLLSGQVNLLTAPSEGKGSQGPTKSEENSSQKGGNIKNSLDRSLGAVGPAITKKMVPGEPPYLQEGEGFALLLCKGSSDPQPLNMTMGGVQLRLPTLQGDQDDLPSVQGISFEGNPFWWSSSKMPPQSQVISLAKLDAKGKRVPQPDPAPEPGKRSRRDTSKQTDNDALQMQMSVSKPEVEPNVTFPKPQAPYWLSYHKFYVNNSAGLLHITLLPAENNSELSYRVYVRNGSKPTPNLHDFSITLPHNQNSPLPLELHNTMVLSLQNLTAKTPYYLAIEQIGGNFTDNESYIDPVDPYSFNDFTSQYTTIASDLTQGLEHNASEWNASLSELLSATTSKPFVNDTQAVNVSWFRPYMLTFSEIVCMRWSEVLEDWITSAATCQISEDSTPKKVKFKSNLFGSFGVGLFTPPNLIDFSTVFDDVGRKLLESIHVVATIAAIFAVYIIVLPVLRRMDIRDMQKWRYQRLVFEPEPSEAGSGYEYRVSVFTGGQRDADTSSNVFFILTGVLADTGVRVLAGRARKGFKRGGVDNFVLWSAQDLGELRYLHVWHDNSGTGSRASWFLSRVRVTDVARDNRTVFACERWLGRASACDCVLVPTSPEQLQDLGHVPGAVTVYDEHLWLSVAIRPSASSFSRVQRWSCCISLLFLSMVANAMWYATDTAAPARSAISLGALEFTVHDVYVSVMSCLTVFPVSIIIVYIFQHTRQRRRRPRPRRTTGKSFRAERYRTRTPSFELKTVDSVPNMSPGVNARPVDTAHVQTKSRMGCVRRLPHCCLYVGWMLVVASILVSAFFTVLYSLDWGGEKSRAWLIAFCLSTIENIFIVTPAKVIIVILFYTLFLAKPTNDDDDSEDYDVSDEKDSSQDEVSASSIFAHGGYVKPPNSRHDPEETARVLEEAQQRRKDGLRNAGLLRGLVGHSVYLAVLLYIAYTSQAPLTQHQNQHTTQLFLEALDTAYVHPGERFWAWVRDGFVQSLFAVEWYNGEVLGGLDLLETANRGAIRQGPARLRQLRAPESCKPPPQLAALALRCYGPYGRDQVHQDNSTRGWTMGGPHTDHKPSLNPASYTYQDSQVKGVDFWGYYDSYSLGGYMITLPDEKQRALELVKRLRHTDWLDGHTRAVFAEVTLFNMNANLFTRVRILFEFPAIGGLVVTPNVKSVRLYDFSGAGGVVYLAAQVVAALVMLGVSINALLGMARLRKAYFRVGWNQVTLIYLLAFYLAVTAYTFRTLETMEVVEDVHNKKGSYVDFDGVFLWGEIFNITFGLVTFLAILQLLRLLSFNRNMWLVGATMTDASDMLIGFGFSFILMLVAFATLGVNLFAPETPVFKEVVSAFLNLSTMLLGKFDYVSMGLPSYSYAELSARCFFLVYNLVVYWIMTSMAISLLSASVTSAREVILSRANEADVIEYLWNNMRQAFPGLDTGKHRPVQDNAKLKERRTTTAPGPPDSLSRDISLEHFIKMRKRPSDALLAGRRAPRQPPEGQDSLASTQDTSTKPDPQEAPPSTVSQESSSEGRHAKVEIQQTLPTIAVDTYCEEQHVEKSNATTTEQSDIEEQQMVMTFSEDGYCLERHQEETGGITSGVVDNEDVMLSLSPTEHPDSSESRRT